MRDSCQATAEINWAKHIPITFERRGEAGFGSSDAHWLQAISAQDPGLTLFINERSFSGLLDPGADMSVITASQGLSMWPMMETVTQLQGEQ